MPGSASRFKQTNLPRQPGELARLKIVQGPDYGAVYVISGVKAKIGRGEDNDVVISDLKASRHHAALLLSQGAWVIRDAGSANGIHYNGRFVRELPLKGGEVVTLGETTLEFLASQSIGTQVLAAPVKDIVTLRAEQAALADKRREVRGLGHAGGRNAGARGMLSGPAAAAAAAAAAEKNKRTLLFAVIAVGAMAYLFLDNGKPPPAPAQNAGNKASTDVARDLASFLPQNQNVAIEKSAESFFRAGFREFRERNYLRARSNFETVLQILPGHPLATLYLENCKQAIDDEVRSNLEEGKRSIEAGKLKEAEGHFEAVTRLLYKDQKNPAFLEATEQIDKLKKSIAEGGYG